MWDFSSTAVTFDSTSYTFDGNSTIVLIPSAPYLSASFSFTLQWTAVTPVVSGDTITYTINLIRNGITSTLSTAQTGVTFVVTNAVVGDIYQVYSNESNGSASTAASYIFTGLVIGSRARMI